MVREAEKVESRVERISIVRRRREEREGEGRRGREERREV